MAVCATCYQPGIHATDHDCPGYAEIQVTRQLGRGVIVDTAPPRALIGLRIVRDLAWPANIADIGDPDLVNIADQVLYRVVGYDAERAALIVDLVEDWRPVPTATISDVEYEALKAKWLETYGKPGTAHPTVEIPSKEQ